MACLTEHCGEKRTLARGVCCACYSALCRRIKQKRLTWRIAEDLGLCKNSLKPRKLLDVSTVSVV